MPKPPTITATYRIVTPMFLGGANQEASTIRPPSIKGALRFWWRALNWGELSKNASSTESALGALHSEESRLFGHSHSSEDEGENRTNGVFILKVSKTETIKPARIDTLNNHPAYKLTPNSWQNYLLGLGLCKNQKKMIDGREKRVCLYTRSALISGSFSVSIIFRPNKNTDQLAQDMLSIEKGLLTFGLLGGLGSRARKGMGSITITDLQGGSLSVPGETSAYLSMIKPLIFDVPAQTQPPFTAFSKQTKGLIKATDATPWHALENIAKQLQLFRGWGFKFNDGKHKINGEEANHTPLWKSNDRNYLQKIVDSRHASRNEITAPNNILFGLPRSYKTANGLYKEVMIEPSVNDKNINRRASPLFIHIHQTAPDQEALIVLLYMPSLFLPSGMGVDLKQQQGTVSTTHAPKLDDPENINPIELFLKEDAFKTWNEVTPS